MSESRYILIVTVGRMDLKVLVRGGGQNGEYQEKPFEACRGGVLRTVRELHALTLRKREDQADDQAARLIPAIDPQELADASVHGKFEGLLTDPALHDAQERLLLYPAKVAPIARGLQRIGARIAGIAVVHTNRKSERGEPVASGPWVLKFLRETFDCDAQRCHLINAIHDDGRFEGDPAQIDDFPLRRKVVQWVHQGLIEFQQCLGADARDVIPILLSTGGMAPIKDILFGLVPLQFLHAPRDLSTPDGKIGDEAHLVQQLLQNTTISRIESTQARARALYLVRRGDYVGAWAAVAHFEQSKLDRWWLRPLCAVAAYFGGATRPASSADTIPQQDVCEQVLDRINMQVDDGHADRDLVRHQRFALNAAFRVEAALQGPERESRRHVDALTALCTLLDVAVVARALQFLTESPLLAAELRAYACKRKFFDEDNGLPTSNREAWFGKLGNPHTPTNRALQEAFKPLIALNDALLKRLPGRKDSLRSLRNNASHRALSSVEVESIAALAEHAGVWNLPGDAPMGDYCLAPERKPWEGYIDTVLTLIGVAGAQATYTELIDSLVSLLQQPESESEP